MLGIGQHMLQIADAAEHSGDDINAMRMHHETLVPRLPAMAVIGLPWHLKSVGAPCYALNSMAAPVPKHCKPHMPPHSIPETLPVRYGRDSQFFDKQMAQRLLGPQTHMGRHGLERPLTLRLQQLFGGFQARVFDKGRWA